MNRARKLLVGTVATLSLLGGLGVAQAGAAQDDAVVMTTRWCC
ncbi:hypothetical protein [Nocardioides salsibiostraticola]